MKTVKGNINEALRQVASYNSNRLTEAMSKKMPLDVFARTVGVDAKEQQWIMDNEDEFGKYYNNSALKKSWLSLSYPVYDKDYYFAFIGDSERVNAKLNAEANRKLRDLAKSSLSNEDVYEEMEKLFNMFAYSNVGAGDTMTREELWRAVRHIRGDYRESVEEGKLGNIARALLDKMRKRAKKIRIGEDLQEADMFKVAKEFEIYARKSGGIDKKDFMRVAGFLRDIGKNSNVNKQDQLFIQMKYYIDKLDTDVRDGMITLFQKNGMVKNNRLTREGLNEEDNLNEARIVVSTVMYDAITKLGLAQIMKKHDAYVNKQQTDKEYTTLSSPSPMFGRDLSNLIKKNSDKLMKILPEETQVMINEKLGFNGSYQRKSKYDGKEFDRNKEFAQLKKIQKALEQADKLHADLQYPNTVDAVHRIWNHINEAYIGTQTYMDNIKKGEYDGEIDMDN